jgi:hypothetical protein
LREQRLRGPANINPWTQAWLIWVQKEAGLIGNCATNATWVKAAVADWFSQ